ncbi:ELONGATED HYPOCOTYL 4, cryptochrome 1, BLUE LIGHT UNINHIBITED 1, OUT OF PHASE 2 [Hibiscus trionum]|uniref:ELONGATED HYPOCOTYL 4, cryptochrome 1, BLUE LIGHT UNINHIBITED 1, OUT OF PHASE 2 n=1 Tax=Hibiscus trionum TaxID=183268 RepID=A0A9W7HRI7_HIBTR|nr:ELONGATED HYPOCOTYL 4, cryptochrome 1, BLUE LIGHT UNINHIBITED 1, OUT OF PHASE 2 [Hibiscus trionum]
MSGGACSIVWFRRDLRVEDNPALAAGVRVVAVVTVFVWASEEEGHYQPRRVSRWWLKHSLAHLDSSLRSLGTCLITKRSFDNVLPFSRLLNLLVLLSSSSITSMILHHW